MWLALIFVDLTGVKRGRMPQFLQYETLLGPRTKSTKQPCAIETNDIMLYFSPDLCWLSSADLTL